MPFFLSTNNLLINYYFAFHFAFKISRVRIILRYNNYPFNHRLGTENDLRPRENRFLNSGMILHPLLLLLLGKTKSHRSGSCCDWPRVT